MKDYITDVKPITTKNTIMKMKKEKHSSARNFQNSEFLNVRLKESRLHLLSRRSRRKFSVEKTIDLHGLKQNEAFDALLSFFIQCRSENIKKVIVITGGNNIRKSVIRSSFQKWVRESFGSYVVSCSQANAWHGGEGAFYLVLKNDT